MEQLGEIFLLKVEWMVWDGEDAISFAGKLLFEALCDRAIAAKQTLEATNI